MMKFVTVTVACSLLILGFPSASLAQTGKADFFEKHIRPLLIKRCISCHGPKKQESGLRLDSRAAALAGGEIAGAAINLKTPGKSALLRAVRREGDIAMPPNSKLSEQEIRAIETWLKAGAVWPGKSTLVDKADPHSAWQKHWAAQPIRDQKLPQVKNAVRVYQPLDAFVLARLEKRGLKPSPIADPRTLIRRAHFVLTGLPPNRDEIEGFTKQFKNTPRVAMQQLVDRLLESPHYGERWARHWLDVARYADNKGYVRLNEQPNYYYAYTYRDYVVRSFNDDLPYNQFVLEQLAADRLLSADARPVGGARPTILPADDNRSLAALGFLTLGRRFTGNQHDVIDDRIDVVTRGLMGLTITCARCHDHKFDPIATDDYYALYGVFASTTEPADLPYLRSGTDRPVFYGDMKAYREKLDALDKKVNEQLSATFNMLRDDTTRYLHGVLVGRKTFLVPLPAAKGELRQTFVERWVEYLEGTKRSAHPVFAAWHTLRDLPKGEFVAQAPAIIEQTANPIIRQALQKAKPKSMAEVADVYGKTLVAIHRKWQAFAQPPNGDSSTIKSKADPAKKSLSDPAEEQLRQVLYGGDSSFSMSAREALDAYLLDANINLKLAKAYLNFDAWLIGTGKAADRAHVLYDSPRVHEPHIFIRGNPERTGRRVARAAPQLLGKQLAQPFRDGSGRLELARAIVDPRNPLTARVIVNRVWKEHFGKGLVGTTSNFGLRAEPPTHPRLLDYLAHRFVHEGWSTKQLHRWIMLSSTWQQASVDHREVDPENDLLWRANRRRLDFETLRDTMLAVSGRLNLKMGGPPISLLAPDNVRRTLYGHIDRSKLPSILRLFDFPSPDTHSPARSQTTAPQQALYLLNNPFVMEQAKALAERAKKAGNGSTASTITELYWLTLGRPPSDDELKRCERYVEQGDEAWNELAQALLVSNEMLFVD